MKTVSLELSKQLKEAGYPQESSSFYWNKSVAGERAEVLKDKIIGLYPFELSYASPTADEILELLPMIVKDGYYRLHALKTIPGWDVFYKPNGEQVECLVIRMGSSLADAAAEMWLYLKKEGLI